MFDHELGHVRVVLRGHVEGRGHDGTADGALHIRDLLGTLVYEKAEEVHLGVVCRDGLADLLEHGGLAGLGRAHDESTLTLTDGSHEVDGTAGDGLPAVLHDESLVGVDGREIAKARTALHGLGLAVVDAAHVLQGGILAVAASGADGAFDAVTGTQAILADDRLVNEGVVLALHVVPGTYPAVAFVSDLEYADYGAKSLDASRREIDGLDELRLADANVVDTELGRLGPQVGDLHLEKLLAGERGACDLLLPTAAIASAIVVAPVVVIAVAVLPTTVVAVRTVAVIAVAATVAATVAAKARTTTLGVMTAPASLALL